MTSSMSNKSEVTKFLLHGFSEVPEIQMFHFIAFLVIYLVVIMENFLIITVIIYSHHLHKPMYFFLANLAFQDLGSISVTVPKSIADSLLSTKSISYLGCICQVFFLIFFSLSHFFLLGIMAYDRYTAICNPLQYEAVMNRKACILMAISSWASGLFYGTVHAGNVSTIEICSSDIYQFFCEIPQLFKVACSDSYLIELWAVYVGFSVGFIYFSLIIYSYVQIIRAVLRIPSTQGKQKAFSTCLPHLIVMFLYVVSCTVAYLRPVSRSVSTSDLLISMLYCVVPPLMNPLIYSIRNKELKFAFWKMMDNIFPNSYQMNFRK